MKPFTIAALALLAAGCLGAPDAPAAPQATPQDGASGPVPATAAPPAPPEAVEAPTWRVGDAWRVVGMSDDGAQSPSEIVVVSATDGGYVTATTGEELAVFDALFDVSYLGPVRKADLAGAQQGEPVRFFAFPLVDGKSWTTTWDGLEVVLVAKRKASGPGFDIEGKVGNATYVTYDYDPALRWWSHVDFDGYSVRVERRVENWTGQVLTASAAHLLTLGPAAPGASAPAGSFTVSEGQSLVAVAAIGATARQARAVVFVDPTGAPAQPEGAPEGGVSPDPASEFAVWRLPPTPGAWKVAAPSVYDHEGFSMLAISEVLVEPRAVG